MTAAELISAGIPIADGDVIAALRAEAALDWLAEYTTLQFDKAHPETIAALPACAKIFILKYSEVMKRKSGLVSQSIEGMSMSFGSDSSFAGNIWQLANGLLGGYIKSQVRVFPARKKW